MENQIAAKQSEKFTHILCENNVKGSRIGKQAQVNGNAGMGTSLCKGERVYYNTYEQHRHTVLCPAYQVYSYWRMD